MGSVQGKLYDMGEYPAAIPGTEDYFITGELYHIAQEEEFARAMEQLDEYEGLLVEPAKHQYSEESWLMYCLRIPS
jgi:hypothetical protein